MKTHTEGNVTLHHVDHAYDGYCDEVSDLGPYDASDLADHGIVEAWYWYRTGSYEGDGQLIGRAIDGKWSLLSLSHCSCMGPCEDAGVKLNTLDELAAYPFEDRAESIAPILEAIRTTQQAQEAAQ